MSERRTAVVLQRPKHRIGIDLVAGRCEETAAIVAAQVVTQRTDHAGRPENAASVKHGVGKLRYRTGVVDAAAAARRTGRVAVKRGVEHVQPRAVESITTGVDGAAKGGPVAAERAVEHRQRRGTLVTFIAPAAARRRVGRVAAEGAVDYTQRRVVIIYAAPIQAGSGTVDDAEAGNPRASSVAYMEDAARMVGIDCQVSRTRTVDAHNLVHDQFAASKRDRLSIERRVEVDRVLVMRIRERLTQGTRAAVILVADRNGCRLSGRQTKQRTSYCQHIK